MTPLAPLYLLAAFAIAGPILFHLWRRTPRGRREFSTLMFLTPSPPRITSRSRIEHWLLLLLRASVLCLLALAFARPLWRTAITGPEKADTEELIAVLVDTSASLRREGIWEDLVRQVNAQLDQLPPSATVAVYRFDDYWSAVADFAELKPLEVPARREVIAARLKELKPGWGATNLGEALIRTAGALQEVQTERSIPVKLRILLASDLQSGGKLDALNGFEWPTDLRLQVLTAQPASPSNAGLQWVERNLDLPDDLLRVRVTNVPDSRKEQFQLAWAELDIPSQSVYVPAGQSRVVVAPKRPQGATSTKLVLTGDDNVFDNTLYLAPVRDESRLVVYFGTDQPDDATAPRFYLEGVFAASQRFRVEIRGWRDALAATNVERPAFVVLVAPEPDAGDFVRDHLSQGGTVLIAAQSAAAETAALKQCGIDDVNVTEADVKRDSMIGDLDFEHPLLAPFAESQFSDFTGIRFWKHRKLAGFSPNQPTSEHPHSGQVLARFDDGDPAFVEFKQGTGRVWVMTSGWNPADSQLARSSKFPPLLFRMLEEASGATAALQNVTVGKEIRWPQSFTANTAKALVRRPDGSERDDLSVTAVYAETDTPGLYTRQVGNNLDTVAVNLAPDESRTAPLPMEQLESLGVRLGTVETSAEQRRTKERQHQLQIEELEETQKLWRWGILLTIALLLAETWIAGRRPAAVPEAGE